MPISEGQRDFFQEEVAKALLRFATSMFHAYTHLWTCQLQYNPRVLPCLGLCNGEDMERIWSALSGLTPANRVSTASNSNLGLHTMTMKMTRDKQYNLRTCAV